LTFTKKGDIFIVVIVLIFFREGKKC